ncbi:DUF3822 family protein [Maribacter sp. HTCC2170]|uniref:DUF3822 family protein n=1 Tax=Maribacter sp. (strain HTCC2170 / KCCM 42371) TaxID=313603 RepID=UPI00006B4859|nr:DUF3822 family protein [Maribacter sp. HTCC2170]EAR01884.1 hypothetical protein FB2170_15188 [Maribacter sp. HTCC2170]
MTKKKINNTEDNSLENFNKLSIQVSLNGLSFCVLDTIGNIILKSDRLTFPKNLNPFEIQKNLEQLLETHDLKSKEFSEVVIVHSNGLFSFVPKSLFDESELANYLKFNTKILANDHIAYDELDNYDMVNVYVPFVNINNYIFDLFGEFEYKHNGTVLVQALLNNSGTSKEPICYAHVDGQQMDITIIAQKKLLLYNSFTFTSKEDFIYYLLFTLEQLKLDTENTKLKLFGSIEEGDDVYDLCYQYVKDISIFIPSVTSYPMAADNEESIDFTVLNAL